MASLLIEFFVKHGIKLKSQASRRPALLIFWCPSVERRSGRCCHWGVFSSTYWNLPPFRFSQMSWLWPPAHMQPIQPFLSLDSISEFGWKLSCLLSVSLLQPRYPQIPLPFCLWLVPTLPFISGVKLGHEGDQKHPLSFVISLGICVSKPSPWLYQVPETFEYDL